MSKNEKPNQAFLQMIALAASGASGKAVRFSDPIDWQKVIPYAQEQCVLPLLGCTLLHNPDVVCPEELRNQLINSVRSCAGGNMVRRVRVMQLLAQMDAEGLNVKLIKGYAVADCYQYPECRDSTDIDVLISGEQEFQVYAFLKKQGFQITPRGKAEHHAVGLHPKLGKLEVHVRLYPELVSDVWLKNVNEKELVVESPVSVLRNGEIYRTLGYTDHLIFLTLHMVRHFIRSGMNVRMMIDVAQYFAANKNKIDAARYWHILEMLHYRTVLRCIFEIMGKTGCFTQSDFPELPEEPPDGMAHILRDLETGGNMGVKEEGRILDAYEYTRQMLLYSSNTWQYYLYMLRHKLRSGWHQMFPAKDEMMILYPAVKKYRILYPVARVHRMLAYPLEKIRSGILKKQIRTDTSPLPQEAQRRMEMFKELNMHP